MAAFWSWFIVITSLLGITGPTWDINTGVNSGKYISFLAEDGNAYGGKFSYDGAHIYMAGIDYKTIYQYNLSTNWDLSTGSYSGKSYSVAAQFPGNACYSVDISRDGTKMFVLNPAGIVYQYTLSTPWDVSTASYSGKSYTYSIGTWNIAFSFDGSKLYYSQYTGAGQGIYQHTLSTPWDVSTASYSGKYFDCTAQGSPYGFAFSIDGARLYIGVPATKTIYQYKLSIAWDISTASYATKSMDVSAGISTGQLYVVAAISPDGTKAYCGVTNLGRYLQYSLA